MQITFQKFDYKTQLKQHQVLFAECFPEVYNNNEYSNHYEGIFLHLYHKFPGLPTSYQYAAMLGNELIGYYAALPYRYKIGNKTVKSGMVCGVMTSPKYRKMGIFTKLGNYTADEQKAAGVSFNLTFPIRKAVMPGFMRMGWDIAFEMPLFIRFLKVTSLLKNKKLGFLAFFINPLISTYNSLCKNQNNKDYEIRTHTNVDEIKGYDDFQNKWNASVTNSLIKDKAFLKWRYGSPGKKYLFFCAYKAESLVGIISARAIMKIGVPSYGILDFMVIDKNCLSNLHNAVFNRAKIEKKEAIMMMMSKYSSKNHNLIRNAYLKSPFRFHLIINILSQEFSKKELYSEELWHLMFVDSDDL
jgi:hypothetical protein